MSINEACCSLPPAISDYTPKGTFEKVDDLPVYFVGPKDAKKAVVLIYDIFGLQ
ncbi:hypothetical protein K7432_015247 [Basidiobolus ranarum]|uniref:Carboxymethylenebutenolidase n=1 Tax=Basidiobolus ranarum TaxID=34480 RepID=A0ABR2VNB6_9FUNG